MATVSILADRDTWINQNDNYQNSDYSSGEFIRIGDAIDNASRAAHGLLHFTLKPTIPVGAQITGARLRIRLYEKEWTSDVDTATMNVYRVIAPWSPYENPTDWLNPWMEEGAGKLQSNWSAAPWYANDANSYDRYSSVLASFVRERLDTTGVYQEIDLGSLGVETVQYWLDHDESELTPFTTGYNYNGGLLLSGAAPGTASKKNAHYYRSSNSYSGAYGPFLDVDYIPDGAPTLNNDVTITLVTATSMRVNGSLSSDGNDALASYGFFFGPVGGTLTYHQVGTGTPTLNQTFSHDITGLTEGTAYRARSYAVNDAGEDYGYNSQGLYAEATTLDIQSKSGDGGAGITDNITGDNVDYAGGGGGGHTLAAQRGTATHGGGAAGVAGTANTGGGGGANAAGGKGIAIFKYAIADAISATPALANDVFKPSLAYHNGRLFAPYADPDGMMTVNISSITQGVDTTINTSSAHGLEAGQVVAIAGTACTPDINGIQVVKAVTDSDTFTIELQTTAVTTGTGVLSYNHLVGYAYTGDGYEDAYIRTSRSSFHTGSLMKDFRYISIIHEPIPSASVLGAAYTIDDTRYPTTGFTPVTAVSAKESRLPIKKQGFEIDMELSLEGSAQSIVVKGFNVVWNFLKIPKHLYSLDVREGAGSGRWKENPEEALQFLFSVADAEAEFEDRFNGTYNGTVEQIEYQQANHSLEEGPQGLVKLLVREVK